MKKMNNETKQKENEIVLIIPGKNGVFVELVGDEDRIIGPGITFIDEGLDSQVYSIHNKYVLKRYCNIDSGIPRVSNEKILDILRLYHHDTEKANHAVKMMEVVKIYIGSDKYQIVPRIVPQGILYNGESGIIYGIGQEFIGGCKFYENGHEEFSKTENHSKMFKNLGPDERVDLRCNLVNFLDLIKCSVRAETGIGYRITPYNTKIIPDVENKIIHVNVTDLTLNITEMYKLPSGRF